MSNDVFKGYAVRDGRIRFTSVTQIAMADEESDGGCLRKWFYAYVAAVKLPKTAALVKGADLGEKLFHYLTTGEPVLPPILEPAQRLYPEPRPPFTDLECEQKFATGEKGADILKAIALREALFKGDAPKPWPDLILAEIKKFAGLTINGIPVDGAADFRHRRGEFVDEDGVLKSEPRGCIVVETGDQKVMSRIHPEIVKSGPNAGMILRSYAKNAAEICNDVQMLSYGVFAADKYLDSTHQRLSYVISSKKKREAVKRTGLISVDELRSRFRRFEGVVHEMEGVAQATRAEDVRPCVSACDSFTHVDPEDPTNTLPGCGYRYICPLSTEQVGPTLMGRIENEENVMSLFDQLPQNAKPPAPPTPPPPPVDQAAYDAEVAVERAKFEGNAPPAPPRAPLPEGYSPVCNGRGSYTNGQGFIAVEPGHKCAGCAQPSAPLPPSPPPPPSYPSIVPPDAPKSVSLLDAAAPLSQAEIDKITDPALKARVEQHAREHAARTAAEEATKAAQGASSWCAGSSARIIITNEIGAKGGYSCACTKHWTVKALKPAQEADGTYYASIPRHRPLVAPAAAQPPAPPASPAEYQAPGALAGQTAMPSPVVAPPPPAPIAADDDDEEEAEVSAPPAPPVTWNERAQPPAPPAPPSSPVVGEMTEMVNDLFGPEGASPPPSPPTNGHVAVPVVNQHIVVVAAAVDWYRTQCKPAANRVELREAECRLEAAVRELVQE